MTRVVNQYGAQIGGQSADQIILAHEKDRTVVTVEDEYGRLGEFRIVGHSHRDGEKTIKVEKEF